MRTEYFDKKSAGWDSNPIRAEMTRNIAAAIRQAVSLSETMSAMEFGCGTGLISRELLPHLKKIKAVDFSPGMIEKLQHRIEESGLQNLTACCLDIFTEPPDEQFDLIFSGMVLHHIQDTAALLDALLLRLKPGGFIALADLDTEDGTFHGDFDGFLHHGFDRERLIQELRSRKCGKTAARTAHIVRKNDREYPVFLITAQKIA
jgi:2-polyprenyl-3-methyl-5-hydroxy-6-metoxy-1,4-benzoquinol methylase